MPVPADWTRRTELCDWLAVHDIDPNLVPIDGDLTIADTEQGRVIRVEVCVVNEHGRRTFDERGQNVATEIRTVPLTVEPPVWWTPYEKPTREQLLAVIERVRGIPRLPHHSQQTGELGRAYTRGWESVISALDKALDGEEQPGA